ncbi:hypothetical protein [Lentibacillus cibarius]|uniref:Uncharacterized protein n=1 Tax=Lentibacillus cibarius TaxID=2583219 RepID=A0A5S3QMH8_9BACI|nr:hypothetical protein [Lentibacillus cibarius]TMN23164.1 hypothetical protein FFL34_14500 [Lentibacillus cibarius]
MSNFEQVRKNVESKLDKIRKGQLEVTELDGQIRKKQQEKVNLMTQGVHGDELRKRHMLIDAEVEELEEKKRKKELETTRQELEIKENMKDDLATLKEERKKKVQEFSAEVEKMNEELFEAKLEYLKKVYDAGQKQVELQEELDGIGAIISKIDEKDRKQHVPKLDTATNRYGKETSGVLPEPNEVVSIEKGQLNPHTVPASTRLYIMTGEVERNNKEAQSKMRKGGK